MISLKRSEVRERELCEEVKSTPDMRKEQVQKLWDENKVDEFDEQIRKTSMTSTVWGRGSMERDEVLEIDWGPI